MSFMVVRKSSHSPTGKSYVGPFRSLTAANREADAWNATGLDPKPEAGVFLYDAALKAEVRAWERAKRVAS